MFDGTSWHDAAGIPVTGDHVAAASDGKYVYVVGGRKLSSAANTAAVQRFDPNTGKWTQLRPVPSPVSDCGVAVVSGQLIVVGGESTGTVFNTVRAFDLATSTWSSLPPLAAARHGMGVTARNTLYAIDGAAAPGHNASTRTLQILTLPPPWPPAQLAGSWRRGPDSLYATQQVGAAVLQNLSRIWVAGGLTGLDTRRRRRSITTCRSARGVRARI